MKARMAAAAVAFLAVLGCGIGELADRPGEADRQDADAVVRAAIADVERYWAGAFPPLADGEPFEKVTGYHPYTRRQPPPDCGGQPWEYQPNAFYCPDGDFIAWDAETLVPQLYADYGRLLVAVVVAHEYGHAIQARLGSIGRQAIVVEQQADCFAGAWVAEVRAGRVPGFTADDLDGTLAGLLSLRDAPGSSARSPQAHGNAFDRVRALQEGVEQGAGRCAGYRAGNLPVTEVPFSTEEEAASGGDLPYDEALSGLSEDVQAYWGRAYPRLTGRAWTPLRVVAFDPDDPPACPGREPAQAYACPGENFVAFDGEKLGPQLHEKIGDNAVGMLIGNLFARAAQERRGASAEGRDGQLTVDCLAGSWAYDMMHRGDGEGIRLSPGDLDEAVAALLVFGRSGGSGDATAFDRIGAFRTGVLEGLPACA